MPHYDDTFLEHCLRAERKGARSFRPDAADAQPPGRQQRRRYRQHESPRLLGPWKWIRDVAQTAAMTAAAYTHRAPHRRQLRPQRPELPPAAPQLLSHQQQQQQHRGGDGHDDDDLMMCECRVMCVVGDVCVCVCVDMMICDCV